MEFWSVYRPVVADSHHFDEKQDPDPHFSGNLDPDPHKSTVKNWFLRVCITNCHMCHVTPWRSADEAVELPAEWRRRRGHASSGGDLSQNALQFLRPAHSGRMFSFRQCSGSVGLGSVCLWAFWLRILISSSKIWKKNLDFLCFVTSF
jgi:hypothetical protein